MKKRKALLVGIDKYEDHSGLSPLRYAEADVDMMSNVLQQAGFTTSILKGKAATHDTIVKTLREFYNEQDLGAFLFYFAGHGEMMVEVGKFCLHCFGSEVQDTIGALSLAEIAQRIRNKIPASSAALIVDACRNRMYRDGYHRGVGIGFNHPVVTELRAISNEVPRFWDSEAPESPQDQFLVTFLSCGPGQFSYEDSELGHGIFTYGLVQELRGCQEPVSLGVVRKRVGDFTRARCRHKNLVPIQTPEWIEPSFSGEFFLGGEFFFGEEPSNASNTETTPARDMDRRSRRRFTMKVPVRARLAHGPENVIPTHTEDISAGGVSMFSQYPTVAGHDITMDITLPTELSQTPGDVTVRTQGKVIRVERNATDRARGWKIAAVIDRYTFLDASSVLRSSN